jgi:hypothetical protein
MNASATIRASYIRATRMSMALPPSFNVMNPIADLESRPAQPEKLKNFTAVNHIEHRENCERERSGSCVSFDANADTYTSFSGLADDEPFARRLKKMFTVFPYRDPIWLVAVVFALGSLDLVLNAFFDLLPRTIPASEFETEETVAVPTTVLIGSILFFAAGIFDTFGALNADRGTLETSKLDHHVSYRPALLGTPEFKWIPSRVKFYDLVMTNVAFQAGLIVLFGGIIFMFAGIVDFPGVVSEENPLFESIVFGPQVVHGALFFLANAMLAFSEQEKWYIPKIRDADWQGAVLNTIGGFGFMMAGLFLFGGDEVAAAISALVGSWAFLIGSLIRWYLVMEFW